MVCKVCQEMLHGQKGRRGSGSQLQLTFRHHSKAKNLGASAEKTGCYICRVIQEKLQSLPYRYDDQNDVGEFLIATLRLFRRRRATGLYQLDFRLAKKDLLVASFMLAQDEAKTPTNLLAKPVSNSTSDPKVIQIAKDWIADCVNSHDKCRTAPDPDWKCPGRLLDLQPMLVAGRATESVRLMSRKAEEAKPGQPSIDGPYVTLSHRWGRKPFFKLTDENLDKLFAGVPLKELPQTFQDAIKVTCELGIRWLWIDALCIIQDQDDLKDWLEESVTMEKVYTHSYCNISATAAEDSSWGLFFERDVNWKWIETVKLNTKDLKDGNQEKVDCTILDLSFWNKCVDDAPVNRRSWVYQERLLSPRVLHWCKDQIAFECREVSKAECRPEGLPHFRIKSGVLSDGVRLKSIDLAAGRQLRTIREASSRGSSTTSKTLQNMVDQVDPKFHLYELWKHWVEVYAKMELTKSRDRLIALSGIARLMSSKMKAENLQDEYIAGMWRKHLASQLLWFVNEGSGQNRQPLENTRPEEYRAPSFSWASVETPRGVTFAETKDLENENPETEDGMPKAQRLLVEVEVVRLSYRTEKDKFGLLTDGYLVLRGVLRKIELSDSMVAKQRPSPSKREAFVRAIDWDRLLIVSLAACLMPSLVMLQFCGFQCLSQYWALLTIWSVCYGMLSLLCFALSTLRHRMLDDPEELPSRDENRYSWRLVQDGRPIGKNYQIVYLDSPASEPSIFGPGAQVYCLPVLREDRYLTCLLVQATDGEYGVRYQRIGLTKVSSLTQELLHNLTTPPGHNKTTLGEYYWGSNSRLRGESTICII